MGRRIVDKKNKVKSKNKNFTEMYLINKEIYHSIKRKSQKNPNNQPNSQQPQQNIGYMNTVIEMNDENHPPPPHDNISDNSSYDNINEDMDQDDNNDLENIGNNDSGQMDIENNFNNINHPHAVVASQFPSLLYRNINTPESDNIHQETPQLNRISLQNRIPPSLDVINLENTNFIPHYPTTIHRNTNLTHQIHQELPPISRILQQSRISSLPSVINNSRESYNLTPSIPASISFTSPEVNIRQKNIDANTSYKNKSTENLRGVKKNVHFKKNNDDSRRIHKNEKKTKKEKENITNQTKTLQKENLEDVKYDVTPELFERNSMEIDNINTSENIGNIKVSVPHVKSSLKKRGNTSQDHFESTYPRFSKDKANKNIRKFFKNEKVLILEKEENTPKVNSDFVDEILNSNENNPYDVFKFSKNSKITYSGLKRKFNAYSKKLHPDKESSPGAHEAFIKMRKAFMQLKKEIQITDQLNSGKETPDKNKRNQKGFGIKKWIKL